MIYLNFLYLILLFANVLLAAYKKNFSAVFGWACAFLLLLSKMI